MSDICDVRAAARALEVDDQEVGDGWRLVIQGLDLGWLDREELEELASHLRDGRDFGVEELLFAHVGTRLRVSLLDDVTECDAGRFARVLAELLHAGP